MLGKRVSQEAQGAGLAEHTSWLIETDNPATRQTHETAPKSGKHGDKQQFFRWEMPFDGWNGKLAL